MYEGKWLTTVSQTNASTFSHYLMGEQRSIPLESMHQQSWWRENIFHYEICMVCSAQNMSLLSYSKLLSMIHLLKNACVVVPEKFGAASSVGDKSKHGSSVRNNSSSQRRILVSRKPTLERRIPCLHGQPHVWHHWALYLPLCHKSWKYNESIITA